VSNNRPEKVSELLKNTLSQMVQSFIEEELDKQVLVTIIRASVDKDLKEAKIYYTVYPSDESEEVKKLLDSSSKHFRYLLSKKLTMFSVPTLKLLRVEPLNGA